jgi:hypothetical protein
MITIMHTAADGTIVDGTTRGDGTNEILKHHGFRWSGTLGSWYLRGSRDHAPRAAVIDALAEQLRTAGHEVQVDVDATPRPTAEVEADRRVRAAARIGRLGDAVGRAKALEADADARARELGQRVPLGQPILVDHYSAGPMRRHYEAVTRATEKAVEAGRRAADLGRRADAARNHEAAREQPRAVISRIRALEVQERKTQRALDGYSNHLGDTFPPAQGEYRDRLRRDLAHIHEQLTHWRSLRSEQVESGVAFVLDRATVAKGDLVKYRGRWFAVERVNPKSVSVLTDPGHTWTSTIAYDDIEEHRRPPTPQ